MKLDTGDYGCGGTLIVINVCILIDQNFIAWLNMGLDGYLVGHSTRGHEKPGFLAQQGCHLILEKIDGGVLTQNVVTNLGCGYGLPHGVAWLGYRVTAEINHMSSFTFFLGPF
jgi:hypothetical protein